MRTLAALLFVCSSVFAQSSAPGDTKTCSVDGSVVNSVTGLPVPRAAVSLAVGDFDISLTTDAVGKWSAPHILCGTLKFFAERFGFLTNGNGVRVTSLVVVDAPTLEAPTPSVVLTADAPLHNLTIKLVPQSVISGRILDENGDPVPGSEVNLAKLGVSKGARGVQMRIATQTNDLGEYRFAGLSAGKYVVCATGKRDTRIPRALAGQCYPGSGTDASAPTMNIAAGYEETIDLRLTPHSVVTVRGTVTGLPEKTVVTVALFPVELFTFDSANSSELTSPVGPDGKFTLRKVPAGAYRMLARSEEADRKRSLLVPLDVRDHDIDDIHLTLDQGAILKGTIRVISASGKKPAETFGVEMQSLCGIEFSDRLVWDESKTAFTIYGVMPTDYRLAFPSVPTPFYVKSVTYGNRDVTASDVSIVPGTTEIEIVLSDDSGSMEGDVTDHDAPANAWVLLWSEGMQPRVLPTDDKGHFRMDAVPPGDYKVFAWTDATNVEYANAEWMRRNARGVAVTVAASEKAVVKVERQAAPDE